MKNKKRFLTDGFTLLETLVSVLIVAILAAVAVPQYQKAVEKSRATQAISVIKTLVLAQQMYYLQHGEYATQFSQLETSIPWTGNIRYHPGEEAFLTVDTRSNKDWSAQLYFDGKNKLQGIFIGRINGPYTGAGFVYWFYNEFSNAPKQEIYCMESTKSAGFSFSFKPSAGAYCQKIMKGKLLPGETIKYKL